MKEIQLNCSYLKKVKLQLYGRSTAVKKKSKKKELQQPCQIGKGKNQPVLKEIFKDPPILSYRKGRSLKDILVRAKIWRSSITNLDQWESCLACLFISHHPSLKKNIWLTTPWQINLPLRKLVEYHYYYVPTPPWGRKYD